MKRLNKSLISLLLASLCQECLSVVCTKEVTDILLPALSRNNIQHCTKELGIPSNTELNQSIEQFINKDACKFQSCQDLLRASSTSIVPDCDVQLLGDRFNPKNSSDIISKLCNKENINDNQLNTTTILPLFIEQQQITSEYNNVSNQNNATISDIIQELKRKTQNINISSNKKTLLKPIVVYITPEDGEVEKEKGKLSSSSIRVQSFNEPETRKTRRGAAKNKLKSLLNNGMINQPTIYLILIFICALTLYIF